VEKENITNILPKNVAFEIDRLCISRARRRTEISEIRLRAYGRSSIVLLGERIFLTARPAPEEIKKTVAEICGGALFAHRSSIAEGYVSLPGGVRVGIVGQARYEKDELVGVSDISSLVFRIPTGKSFCSERLFREFISARRGMLIYSRVGVGKTTALRTLVGMIGREDGENVAVIDERDEFLPEDYYDSSVDLLKGYRRARGIEIALRTLSPSVIAVDELGSGEEILSMLDFMNSGARLLATAHAGDYEELRLKKNLSPLFERGAFDVFAGLSLSSAERTVDVRRVEF
jgi:stage III sporulation protein AA